MRNEEDHPLIDDPDEVENVDDLDGPNVPEYIEGTSPGPRAIIPPDIRRKQRQLMSRLLATGLSDDDIITAMEEAAKTQHFPVLSEAAIYRLRDSIFEKWAEEDAGRNKHLKAAARRRIYRHIEKASAAEQFTAVAGLERTLATIEGTEEAHVVQHNIDLSQNLIAVLGEMSPERLQELISAGTRLYLEHSKADLPSGEKIAIVPSKTKK